MACLRNASLLMKIVKNGSILGLSLKTIRSSESVCGIRMLPERWEKVVASDEQYFE